MSYKIISAEEAASHIHNGDNVGFSGFTAAGSPKAVSEALAKKAIEKHEKGIPFQVGVFSGASTSDHLDGALARAKAIKFRTPYQSNKDLRNALNKGEAQYFDYHLSQLAQDIRYGFLGDIDIAVIEACDITEDGEITLTSGVGNTPTYARLAKRIIIELNSYHPKALRGFHDLYEPADPPMRREIPIYKPSDRIGTTTVKVDPAKILGIVETNVSDGVGAFSPLDETTMRIGQNVANFLAGEMKAGRIPSSFLPIQSGVGNIANAVLGCLGENEDIPPFEMYTEVIQDAVVGLMKEGHCKFASGCSLTLSADAMAQVYSDIDFFRDKIVLRPQELSNNPEIVRRLGLITINTAIEADIFGNINSTHIMGKKNDERHRRIGRLYPKRVPVHLHHPVDCQRRQHFRIRTYGGSPGPLGALRKSHHKRIRCGRPARKIAYAARSGDNRKRGASGLQATSVGLCKSHTGMPHSGMPEHCPFVPHSVRKVRRHAQG